jgi:3-dehydroquinate dehydratase I
MRTVAIGEVTIGATPLLVATSLSDSVDGMLEGVQLARSVGADIVEFRIDRLADSEAVEELVQRAGMPHIVACRTPQFGGFFSGTEEERIERLKAAVHAGATAVDIEFFTEPELRSQLLRSARAHNVPVLIGYENMKETPSHADLIQGLHDVAALKPDLIKLAVRALSYGDLLTVLNVALDARAFLDVPFAAIALGAHGAPSRPMACILGASFTYCAVEPGTVPGQLTIQETRSLIDLISEQRWTCSSS